MADDRFKLDQEDTKKISAWFNSHATSETKCQVCQTRSFSAIPMLFTPIIFNLAKNAHGRGVLIPTVMVECKTFLPKEEKENLAPKKRWWKIWQ